MPAERADLEAALLQAHAAEDTALLVALYTRAADLSEQSRDTEAMCFYLTHAYVFALESGHAAAGDLNRRLAALGRDEVQVDLGGQA